MNFYQRMVILPPEKARKSRQMQFHDKTAYVWGLRYRWDPSLSMNPVRRFAHFMPPCARVWKSMPEYARVCKSMPEYARVCQSMPEYARVCQSVAKVCQSMPEYARVCQSLAKFCQSSVQVIPKSSPSCPQVVPKMSPGRTHEAFMKPAHRVQWLPLYSIIAFI